MMELRRKGVLWRGWRTRYSAAGILLTLSLRCFLTGALMRKGRSTAATAISGMIIDEKSGYPEQFPVVE